MTCKARQFSDEMICGECGLTWDVNDPEPPLCPAERPKETDPRQGKLPLGEPDANR